MSISLFTASVEAVSVCGITCGMHASGDVVFETFTSDTAEVSRQCSHVKRLSSSRQCSAQVFKRAGCHLKRAL